MVYTVRYYWKQYCATENAMPIIVQECVFTFFVIYLVGCQDCDCHD